MNDFFRLAGHVIENRYAVERAVAEGGFGVVYRATHRGLGRAVALKVLKVPDTFSADMKRTFVAQFQQEAQLISQLKHPAIVDVTDSGVITFESGLEAPWMALEWVDGPTLAADLAGRRGHGGRSPEECLALFRPVLEALALAHARGVAHRDLKPGNLMLPVLDAVHRGAGRTSLHATPRMRVLDFGIAKVLEGGEGPGSGHTRTNSSMLAYSPRYAAPEQQSQTRTGPWTDVHALGLLLTEVLVDAAPYVGEDKLQLSIQVLAQTRPTPGRFGVDVGAWEPVLAKAMALLPQDRFTNAGELLDALEAQLPYAHPRGVAPTVPVTGLAQKAPQAPLSELFPDPPPLERSKRGVWIGGTAAVAVALLAAVAVGIGRSPEVPGGLQWTR
jgi:serine/threonine protein kinase